MTIADISSYELAYQIRHHLISQKMSEEQFAGLVNLPPHLLTRFLQDKKPELSLSQIVAVCDTLSITIDSLVYGPVHERKFVQLIRKCSLAERLKATCLYSLYIRSLKSWLKRKIDSDCLKRYIQWLMYFYSSEYENSNSPVLRQPPIQFSSSVCFTRKISQKQKARLEKLIEESKKK